MLGGWYELFYSRGTDDSNSKDDNPAITDEEDNTEVLCDGQDTSPSVAEVQLDNGDVIIPLLPKPREVDQTVTDLVSTFQRLLSKFPDLLEVSQDKVVAFIRSERCKDDGLQGLVHFFQSLLSSAHVHFYQQLLSVIDSFDGAGKKVMRVILKRNEEICVKHSVHPDGSWDIIASAPFLFNWTVMDIPFGYNETFYSTLENSIIVGIVDCVGALKLKTPNSFCKVFGPGLDNLFLKNHQTESCIDCPSRNFLLLVTHVEDYSKTIIDETISMQLDAKSSCHIVVMEDLQENRKLKAVVEYCLAARLVPYIGRDGGDQKNGFNVCAESIVERINALKEDHRSQLVPPCELYQKQADGQHSAYAIDTAKKVFKTISMNWKLEVGKIITICEQAVNEVLRTKIPHDSDCDSVSQHLHLCEVFYLVQQTIRNEMMNWFHTWKNHILDDEQGLFTVCNDPTGHQLHRFVGFVQTFVQKDVAELIDNLQRLFIEKYDEIFEHIICNDAPVAELAKPIHRSLIRMITLQFFHQENTLISLCLDRLSESASQSIAGSPQAEAIPTFNQMLLMLIKKRNLLKELSNGIVGARSVEDLYLRITNVLDQDAVSCTSVEHDSMLVKHETQDMWDGILKDIDKRFDERIAVMGANSRPRCEVSPSSVAHVSSIIPTSLHSAKSVRDLMTNGNDATVESTPKKSLGTSKAKSPLDIHSDEDDKISSNRPLRPFVNPRQHLKKRQVPYSSDEDNEDERSRHGVSSKLPSVSLAKPSIMQMEGNSFHTPQKRHWSDQQSRSCKRSASTSPEIIDLLDDE